MKNWKRYFDGKILNRGMNYYESNAVRLYSYSNTHVYAQVAGTMIYDVDIYFDDDLQIKSMHCNCPYYDNCKHLAATLYYLEDHPEVLKKEDPIDLITSCSHADLIEFLTRELAQNPELLAKLKLYKNKGVNEEFYINKLENSFSSSSEILRFLNMDCGDLIEFKQYDLLFKLCKLIIDWVNAKREYGYFDDLEDIINKLDDITTQLRDVDEAHEGICDFLEYAIATSDDEFILDVLTDAMSRNGDMGRLVDD